MSAHLPSTESSFQIIRRTVELPVSFESFTQKFESTLGRYSPQMLYATTTEEEMKKTVADTVGSQPFGIFAVQDHGRLLGLAGRPSKVKQYVIGDPRLAVQMTAHEIRAALHAPVTMLVYEVDGAAKVDYFTAQSIFGQFGNAQVDKVAKEIDEKRVRLIENLVAEISGASAA
ncbi:hypothetical protein HWV62_15553 [Athelia sp. TMB]|nr:hypothetical protein HWV62_15553 [Athelia sp. TMB]